MEIFSPAGHSAKRHEEPERALASGIGAIRALGQFGMFSPSLVPEEILIDHPERIRALVVEGSNPLLSYSDTARWEEAIEALDLLVVIDPAFTETARKADWVLPTPVGYEKWEIAMFPKRYPEIDVQLRPPVLPARGEALPEPEIYARLLEATGCVLPLPPELEAAATAGGAEDIASFMAKAMEHVGAAVAKGLDPETQVQYWLYRGPGRSLPAPSLVGIWALCQANASDRREGVLRTLGEPWQEKTAPEIGEELFRRILAHPEGVEIARLNPEEDLASHVAWPDGRIRLSPELLVAELDRAIATPPESDPDYPLVLGNGLRTRWTANTIHRDPAWRKGKGSECNLAISPKDATQLGLKDGDLARLVTKRAAAELPVDVDDRMLPGPRGDAERFRHAGGRWVGGNGNRGGQHEFLYRCRRPRSHYRLPTPPGRSVPGRTGRLERRRRRAPERKKSDGSNVCSRLRHPRGEARGYPLGSDGNSRQRRRNEIASRRQGRRRLHLHEPLPAGLPGTKASAPG